MNVSLSPSAYLHNSPWTLEICENIKATHNGYDSANVASLFCFCCKSWQKCLVGPKVPLNFHSFSICPFSPRYVLFIFFMDSNFSFLRLKVTRVYRRWHSSYFLGVRRYWNYYRNYAVVSRKKPYCNTYSTFVGYCLMEVS